MWWSFCCQAAEKKVVKVQADDPISFTQLINRADMGPGEVSVCVCVCECVCECVCLCVCLCGCLHVGICVCACVCGCGCLYEHVCV